MASLWASLVLLVASLALPVGAAAKLAFTHGVASGDVTPFSAVLWTRVNEPSRLKVKVSTDPGFAPAATLVRQVVARPEHDFTAKLLVFPLSPATRYHYHFVGPGGNVTSEVGRFRTPPLPFVRQDVRFTFTGDTDGTREHGVPAFNNFEVLDRIHEENGDFFVYLGDTIYSDSLFAPPAATLAAHRAKYKENRTYDALRDLLGATSTYVIWDDHEVFDNFAGQTARPERVANGRQAFTEYMPLRTPTRELGFFRVFRWGRDVEIFILDERSFRSAEAGPACLGDPAPTLPAPYRSALGLGPAPPRGCLDVLNDPSRTMLGEAQKAVFKFLLRSSRATFKFVISAVPISEIFLLPYDRWEGYRAERDEILSFISDHDIDNVTFLTTDLHTNVVADVRVSVLAGSPVVVKEVITGPVAEFTLLQGLVAAFGPKGAAGIIALVEGLNPPEFSNHNAFGYALVEVDSSARSAAITLKDSTGAILHTTVP